MPFAWLGAAAPALGAALALWFLAAQLHSRVARGTRRLQRLQAVSGSDRRSHVGAREETPGLADSFRAWLNSRGLGAPGEILRLEEQLEQGLVTMTSALRAGLSLVQALEVAAEEAEQPLRRDLSAVLAEYRVGRPLEQCLDDWSRRRRSSDVVFLARSISVHRESGGDLGLVLSNLAGTVRDRRLLRLELQAKTSEARITAAVLVAMVPVLALYLVTFQADMLAPLVREPAGRVGLGYAIVSWATGAVALRRMVRRPLNGGV